MQKVEFDVTLNEDAIKEKESLVSKLRTVPLLQGWIKKYQLDDSYIEKHAYKFKDYLERKKICASCKGIEFCMQKAKGYILELEYNGVLESNACACAYLIDKQRKLMHKDRFLICDMSDEQLLYRFEGIDLLNENKSYIDLMKAMLDACDEDRREGFYLWGKLGTGKTFLCCCYINEMASKGKRCAFVNVSNYFLTLKSKMQDKTAYQKQIDALRKADVVVFDDIGGESVSNWSRDEILLPILNERMENKKITLFTSNYELANLEKYYALNSKIMNDIVGAKRIIERMKALTLEKMLNCKNRRQKNDSN